MSECVLSGRTIDTSHQNALTDLLANDCISDWGAFGSLVLICLFVLPLFTKTCQSKDKGKAVTFHAERGSRKPWKGGKGSKKCVKCVNCHRKGHVKVDYWVKWGGKEGQGP